jgi:hypothetical protein
MAQIMQALLMKFDFYCPRIELKHCADHADLHDLRGITIIVISIWKRFLIKAIIIRAICGNNTPGNKQKKMTALLNCHPSLRVSEAMASGLGC